MWWHKSFVESMKTTKWKKRISLSFPVFVVLIDYIKYFTDPSSVIIFNNQSPSLLVFSIAEVFIYLAWVLSMWILISSMQFTVSIFYSKNTKSKSIKKSKGKKRR